MTHCCEVPISMISNYFGKKQVLRGTFRAIWRIQTQMCPQFSFEPKYGVRAGASLAFSAVPKSQELGSPFERRG